MLKAGPYISRSHFPCVVHASSCTCLFRSVGPFVHTFYRMLSSTVERYKCGSHCSSSTSNTITRSHRPILYIFVHCTAPVISLILVTRLSYVLHKERSTMRLSAFFSILCGASSITALGINCRGSALCTIGDLGGTLSGLIEIVGNIPSGDSFGPKEHIGCQGHLCAFTQSYTQNITAGDALNLLNGLSYASHPCYTWLMGREQTI